MVSEVRGTWGKARQVPSLAALNTGEHAQLDSVSCASPGNCTAGGSYGVPAGAACCISHAFAVSEVNGSWGRARAVSGMAGIGEVSCASAGNCGAVGSGLVMNQVDGAWGRPTRIRGPGTGFGTVVITVVSCAGPGHCSAAGYHQGRNARGIRAAHTVIVSQVDGAWGTARELTGTVGLTRSGRSQPGSLSCATAGNCILGGQGFWQAPAGSSTRAFAVPYAAIQRNGSWGRAVRIRGLDGLSTYGIDLVLDGVAVRVTDAATLEQIAAGYRAAGWPAQVDGDAFTAPFSAPSAGPPPWHAYRFTFRTVVGVATAEPYGATRWRFLG